MALQSDSNEMQYMTLLYLKFHTYLNLNYMTQWYMYTLDNYIWMNISDTSHDEYKVATHLIGSSTFIPGEKDVVEGLSNHTLSG